MLEQKMNVITDGSYSKIVYTLSGNESISKFANGMLVKRFSPASGIRVMSEEESLALTGLMTAVVEEGTATKISGLSYTVAGKTGSAEYSNVKGESHAWFTGFAPADAPQICVTVILEGAGSGGDYAVPMAKRVFNAYFE